MKILALDTSTEACSVALSFNGEITERFELGRRHGERLLPMVQELLVESGIGLTQLDVLAFGRGPGSFTGVRIGVGVVQGLAFGADLPVVPVSSLAALAQGANLPRVLAAFDARMQQVYWGSFVRGDNGLVTSVTQESVVNPSSVPIPQDVGWAGIGSGWDVYHTIFAERLKERLYSWEANRFPHARNVAQLGKAVFIAGGVITADQALPIYLRDNVAVKPNEFRRKY